MAPKRNRMDDDDKGGPSKVQLKGLSWNANAAQPKFLKNALAALQGPKPARDLGDESGRPPIPTRPEGEEEEESEEDEWDMGRGEEAPAVVVLREGKHLGRDEVERMRAEAKATSAPDPLASSSAPTGPTKATGSLSFASSSSSAKPGASAGEKGTETWDEVIARSKTEALAKAAAKEKTEAEMVKEKEKQKKAKEKAKKKDKKKIGMLSFGDDE